MEEQNMQQPTGGKPKRPWMPATKQGRRALWFLAAIIIFVAILPLLASLFDEGAFLDNNVVRISYGMTSMAVILVLAVTGMVLSSRAVFKFRDRAILAIGVFGAFCLVCAFILVFAVGEVAFPH